MDPEHQQQDLDQEEEDHDQIEDHQALLEDQEHAHPIAQDDDHHHHHHQQQQQVPIPKDPSISRSDLSPDNNNHNNYGNHDNNKTSILMDATHPTTSLQHLQRHHATIATRRMPYLDVLSIQSKRLLSMTRKKLDEQAALRKQKLQQDTNAKDPSTSTSRSAELNKMLELNELLSSVRLLLEPVQIPDLAHTGISLTNNSKEPYNPQRHGLALEMDTKLFYPNGAKNSDIGEYIAQVLEHSQSVAGGLDRTTTIAATNMTTTISPTRRRELGEKTLSASCSAPVLKQLSPLKKKHTTRPKPKPGGDQSLPPCRRPSPLLNPELEKQARQVLAGLRANSTKIGDLINS